MYYFSIVSAPATDTETGGHAAPQAGDRGRGFGGLPLAGLLGGIGGAAGNFFGKNRRGGGQGPPAAGGGGAPPPYYDPVPQEDRRVRSLDYLNFSFYINRANNREEKAFTRMLRSRMKAVVAAGEFRRHNMNNHGMDSLLGHAFTVFSLLNQSILNLDFFTLCAPILLL